MEFVKAKFYVPCYGKPVSNIKKVSGWICRLYWHRSAYLTAGVYKDKVNGGYAVIDLESGRLLFTAKSRDCISEMWQKYMPVFDRMLNDCYEAYKADCETMQRLLKAEGVAQPTLWGEEGCDYDLD